MTHRERPEGHLPTGTLFGLFGGLYAAQAITVSIAQQTLPVILRDVGTALDAIGYLQLVFLPWTLKFLWGPWLDRHGIGPLGHRRGWLLLCQGGLVLCLVVASLLPPSTHMPALIGVLLLVALAGATQDVAIDALVVETVERPRRVLVGSARVAGRNIGYVLGLGLCLPIYAAFGWTPAMLSLATLVALMSVPVWHLPPVRRAHTTPDRAVWASILTAFKRREVWIALGFLAAYQPGARLGGALLGPFLIDHDLSISAVGWFKGTGGTAVAVAAALLAPLVVQRVGTRRTLVSAALANAGVFVLLALAAVQDARSPLLLMTLVLLQAAILPVMLATLYAAVMSWCAPDRAGADAALFQSFNALVMIAGSVLAGTLADVAGHAVNFAAAAALLLVGAAVAAAGRRLLGDGTA